MTTTNNRQDTSLYYGFNEQQVNIVKNVIAKDATNDELALFLHISQKTGLDPFTRQIYSIKRWDNSSNRHVHMPIASIDGTRLVAERTGKYAGQVGPFWCGPDGVWKDIWLDKGNPFAAKIGVLRSDFKEPCWAVARFDAYVQKKKSGEVNSMWLKMGDLMIAKCAESLALRKAFPQELSGVYTTEEMAQDESHSAQELPEQRVNSKPSPQPLIQPIQPQGKPSAKELKNLYDLAVSHGVKDVSKFFKEATGKLSSNDWDRTDHDKAVSAVKSLSDPDSFQSFEE